MKLKHLFLTALVVGSLASCSDDGNGNGPDIPEMKQVDTYLSITAVANNKTVTKGNVTPGKDEVGTAQEDFINTLTAYVFYEDNGALATTKTVTAKDGQSIDKIEDIVVKVDAQDAGEVSNTKLVVFLLANVKLESSPANLEDFKANCFFTGLEQYTYSGVHSTTGENRQYLPMSSEMLSVSNLIAGTAYHNWVEKNTDGNKITYVNGDGNVLTGNSGNWTAGKEYDYSNKIPLTRYVARIQLEELQANFTNNYEDATFTLTRVSVANASNASMLYSEASFGLKKVLEKEGAYDQTNAFYRGHPVPDIDRADYFIAAGKVLDGLKHDYQESIIVSNGKPIVFKGADSDEITSGVTESTVEMPCFYVFEFNNYAIGQDKGKSGDVLDGGKTKDIYTTLIITGNWKNGSIEGERNFRIPVRYANTENAYGVERNNIYKIHATLTGEGTDNPDKNMLNACISFSVEVMPWKVIKQTETDVN